MQSGPIELLPPSSFQLARSSSCSCLSQSLSLGTTSPLGAVYHSNMIPVSGHPFTYLTRSSLCQSLTLGLDMDLEHTVTAYCMSGLSTAQWSSLAAQTRLVCVQYILHRCIFTLAIRARIDSHEHSLVLSPSAISLSDSWRDHSLRTLQIQCFNSSRTVSFVLGYTRSRGLATSYSRSGRPATWQDAPSRCASTRSVCS